MRKVIEMTAERAAEADAKSWKKFRNQVEVVFWLGVWILLIGVFEYIKRM